MFRFFSTEPEFIVECPGDKKFSFTDLLIHNLAKDRLNYDLILVEAKNQKTTGHEEVDDFAKDLEMFGEMRVLGIFCKSGEFPPGHFDSIYKSKHLILAFDEKTFEYFFNGTDSICSLINTKIVEYIDPKKAYLEEMRKVAERANAGREI